MLTSFFTVLACLTSSVFCGPAIPRWRTYTSSSYYYTDYTFPKPLSKHKYLPGPQFCPDTGRTLCKGVAHYPDDHIYQVVSGAKARRFNFSSIFVDEREGDTEPNNELLPDGPPKVVHDGYIVYQTSVHYDYHVPNAAAVPWLYGSAPAAATITQTAQSSSTSTLLRRRRPLIRRQRDDGDERAACPVRTMFIPPQAALNDNSEWKYIVNVQNKDRRFKQVIRVDLCESPGEPCTNEISLPFGYVSKCKQKFIKKKLLALDADGQGTSTENFFVPSCCVCLVTRATNK